MKSKRQHMKAVYCDVFRYFGKYELSFIDRLKMPRQIKYFIFLRKYQQTNSRYFKFIYKYKAKKIGKKMQMEIPLHIKIGMGILMYHEGQIAIHPEAIIGNNVTLSPGVVIGHSPRGKKSGAPIVGNEVWIGQNAAVVGRVNIGNNVLIAANSFVNIDIPSDSIVFGNPCVIKKSNDATLGYINNKI